METNTLTRNTGTATATTCLLLTGTPGLALRKAGVSGLADGTTLVRFNALFLACPPALIIMCLHPRRPT